MSLFGALFSGVSGLEANAQAMGIIADNIANVNTVGYKTTDANFSTLVTESATATTYSPGGVTSSPLTDFTKQGLIEGSSSPTDIAISGDGFFVVNDLSDPSAITGQYLFTRAGSFTPDEEGFLVNTAGLYLQGWPIDVNGDVPVNRSDLTALSTVNIGGLTGTAEATTEVTLQANLQSSQTISLTGPEATTVSLGITSATVIPGLSNGDSFEVTDGSTVYGTFVFNTAPGAGEFSTLDELAVLIDATAGLSATIVGAATDATLTVTGLAQDLDLVVQDVSAPDAATVLFGAATTTVPAAYDAADSAANMASGTITPDFQRSVDIFDSKGGARTITFSYLKSGTANEWYVEVHVEPPSDATNIAPFVNGQVATGIIAFNTDGTLDLGTTTIPTTLDIFWTAELGLDNSTIALDLGTDGQSDGMTQFDAPSNLISSDVNGAIFGTLTAITIDDEGFVTAQFSNGTSRDIYLLAIATFPNPSGLANETGNAYSASDAAGDLALLEPGQGGSGTIISSALESSTVDIAEEFTNMIITQRAYSAASRIITTANDMLDELIRIIR